MPRKYIRQTGVRLQRLRVAEVDGAYGRAMQEPGLLQFTEARHQRQGVQDLRAWVRRMSRDQAVLVRAVWDGRRHVGNIKIGGIEWAHGVGEVGLIIWDPGRGYGRAALALIEGVAVQAGLRQLTLGCYGTHVVMQRLAESCRYVRYGVCPGRYVDAQGQEVDGWRYVKRIGNGSGS